jgi:hypothetical protein
MTISAHEIRILTFIYNKICGEKPADIENIEEYRENIKSAIEYLFFSRDTSSFMILDNGLKIEMGRRLVRFFSSSEHDQTEALLKDFSAFHSQALVDAFLEKVKVFLKCGEYELSGSQILSKFNECNAATEPSQTESRIGCRF